MTRVEQLLSGHCGPTTKVIQTWLSGQMVKGRAGCIAICVPKRLTPQASLSRAIALGIMLAKNPIALSLKVLMPKRYSSLKELRCDIVSCCCQAKSRDAKVAAHVVQQQPLPNTLPQIIVKITPETIRSDAGWIFSPVE